VRRRARRLSVVAPAVVAVVFGVLAGVGAPPALAMCENEALRTGRSASLPDCRAYELVTPERVDSAGGDLEFGGELAHALVSGDGEHMALATLTVFLEPGSHHTGTDAVFSRTADGWVMSSLTAPGMEGETFTPEVFSGDLSLTGFVSGSGLDEAAPSTLNVGPAGGPYTTLSNILGEGTEFSGANAGAASAAAFSDVIFESQDHALLPPGPERQAAEETKARQPDLYDWSEGRLRLVNLNNEGKALNQCGAELGVGVSTKEGNAVDAVSADGARVFFTSPRTAGGIPGCPEPELYMRVAGRETVDVSEPQDVSVPPSARANVMYQGASADGSRVFFTTTSALTPSAGSGSRLYEYDTQAAAGHRLTQIASQVEDTRQEINPGTVVSEDGSSVYFEGTSAIEIQGHSVSISGIWRYETATKTTRFVATPSPTTFVHEPWYATRDGRFLVFDAGGTPGVILKGLHGELETEPRGAGHNEIYRYAADDGSVTCVSCGKGVAPTRGYAVSSWKHDLLTSYAPKSPADISDGGNRVFFESSAQLVPQDTNEDTVQEETVGLGRAADVYEWEAPGTEDGPGTFCHAVNGCTFLLSAGEAVGPEEFLGASEDGRDVFLSSAASLVPGAPSGFTSVYDARIGGGFPRQARPVECTSCQGVGNPPPSFGAPSSATFAGAGNRPLAAPSAGAPKSKPKPRCRRGYRRNSHGRCARVKAKR
jgi:hypothetical protein